MSTTSSATRRSWSEAYVVLSAWSHLYLALIAEARRRKGVILHQDPANHGLTRRPGQDITGGLRTSLPGQAIQGLAIQRLNWSWTVAVAKALVSQVFNVCHSVMDSGFHARCCLIQSSRIDHSRSCLFAILYCRVYLFISPNPAKPSVPPALIAQTYHQIP